MITPSPTTKIDPGHSRGTFAGAVAPTQGRPACIRFAVPNTSYELFLVPTAPVDATPGKRLVGVISASSRRIDVVDTGGQFVEPLVGRPRRVQGTVVRSEGGAVVVDAGVVIHLKPTDARQSADSFQPGQMVSCDVLDGATFSPR
ncbi:MAG: hypothetical protein ACOYN0_13740 [Phycisphaerales bacterium]